MIYSALTLCGLAQCDLPFFRLQGVAKGFLPKGEYTDNYWAFVTGDKLASLPEPRCVRINT